MLTVHENLDYTYTQELFSKIVFGDVANTIHHMYEIASEMVDYDVEDLFLSTIAGECLQLLAFSHLNYQITGSWNEVIGHHFLGELTQEEAIKESESETGQYLSEIISQYDYGGTESLLVEWFLENGPTNDYIQPIEILVFQGALEFLIEGRYALWGTANDQTKVITSAQKSIW